MMGTLFLPPVWAQTVKALKRQTDPLPWVRVLGQPRCTPDPQQGGNLLSWCGGGRRVVTDSTSVSDCEDKITATTGSLGI